MRIQTEPSAPPSPPQIVEFGEEIISLTFAILAGDDVGGSPILDYDLYWDEGSNEAVWVIQRTYEYTGDSGIIETTIESLTSGVTY